MSVANKHLRKDRTKVVLREFAEEYPEWGYERFREGDYRYVLAEAGFHDQDDVEFDEFVEVRWFTPTNGWMDADCLSPLKIYGNLKDVSLVPRATKTIKIERRRTAVEKSGGGV